MTKGRIFREPISRADVARMADELFGDWIKAVVDVSRGIMAIGGELHADDVAVLLASGSRHRDLWGINLHPGEREPDWMEFDSMINLRPSEGNCSRGVDDDRVRARIREVVGALVGSNEEGLAMTGVLHKRPAAGGWARLALVEQLGNVGGEVERAIRAHEAGRTDRFESALKRALELFDLTASDPRWRGHRCQEVLRAREEFCRLFFDPDVPPESARGLRRYFFGFARAARRLRQRRQSSGVGLSTVL